MMKRHLQVIYNIAVTGFLSAQLDEYVYLLTFEITYLSFLRLTELLI